MSNNSDAVGMKVPELIMPAAGVDMTKWAVVACDQSTSLPDYWEETERIVGDSPSTLRLMLPEMYLDKPDEADRIKRINACMNEYVSNGTLESKGEGFVLVRRTVDGRTRTGLVVALDLEAYDYTKGSKTLIRATEGTIVERIPPRLRIRKDAPLEMPHILVLIDDPERTVIEPLLDGAVYADCLYDFELMQGGGHISGRLINDKKDIDRIYAALFALADKDAFHAKYGEDQPPMLFAMGDGNHSFATAKANWEEVKKTLPESERADHPARYCLVEIEIVHDEGIVFEPIHRVLFNVDVASVINYMTAKLSEQNGCANIRMFSTREECLLEQKAHSGQDAHTLPFFTESGVGCFIVTNPSSQLAVGTLQNALDPMLKALGGSIDYIHGESVVENLGRQIGNMGFLLPPMNKSDLFRTVVYDGALPRKTFSMGEAHEKRYYLECRKISK